MKCSTSCYEDFLIWLSLKYQTNLFSYMLAKCSTIVFKWNGSVLQKWKEIFVYFGFIQTFWGRFLIEGEFVKLLQKLVIYFACRSNFASLIILFPCLIGQVIQDNIDRANIKSYSLIWWLERDVTNSSKVNASMVLIEKSSISDRNQRSPLPTQTNIKISEITDGFDGSLGGDFISIAYL